MCRLPDILFTFEITACLYLHQIRLARHSGVKITCTCFGQNWKGRLLDLQLDSLKWSADAIRLVGKPSDKAFAETSLAFGSDTPLLTLHAVHLLNLAR